MKAVCMQYIRNWQGNVFSMFGDGKRENMLLTRATSIIFAIHCFHSYCLLLISSLATRGEFPTLSSRMLKISLGIERGALVSSQNALWLIQSIYAKTRVFNFTHISIVF